VLLESIDEIGKEALRCDLEILHAYPHEHESFEGVGINVRITLHEYTQPADVRLEFCRRLPNANTSFFELLQTTDACFHCGSQSSACSGGRANVILVSSFMGITRRGVSAKARTLSRARVREAKEGEVCPCMQHTSQRCNRSLHVLWRELLAD
jgi:hypothetical protein